MIQTIQNWFRRLRFRPGATISRFIARDVRRDVKIISAARLSEGIVTARVRTTNVLYRSNGLVPPSEFGPETELEIDKLWLWTGQSWGGLPDGTSLVDDPRKRDPSQL
jgi:hypothetical protein